MEAAISKYEEKTTLEGIYDHGYNLHRDHDGKKLINGKRLSDYNIGKGSKI